MGYICTKYYILYISTLVSTLLRFFILLQNLFFSKSVTRVLANKNATKKAQFPKKTMMYIVSIS